MTVSSQIILLAKEINRSCFEDSLQPVVVPQIQNFKSYLNVNI